MNLEAAIADKRLKTEDVTEPDKLFKLIGASTGDYELAEDKATEAIFKEMTKQKA